MSLYSTSNRSIRATWRQAVLSGIAPDGGLYLPEQIPHITRNEIDALRELPFVDLATRLADAFIGSEVPQETLEALCAHAFNFPLVLKEIDAHTSVLELFHGPTCAFKDFGARFMAGLFRYFWGTQSKQLTVLVATSGDTGSAVANAFLDQAPNPPIRVAILYPKNKVSEIQRRQMTTLGHNVTAYEVDGTFDDCQALAKQALCDNELTKLHPLTSANSINIARLLPQMFYYAYAALRFQKDSPPLFSVPSGNLGNLTGGLLAHLVGFRAAHFIAACNANKTFPDFLITGEFLPQRSTETISNAMDVGNPSNFQRISDLFADQKEQRQLLKLLSGYSASDQETAEMLRKFHAEYGYILDPHTAVGACALSEYAKKHSNIAPQRVVVATAHPAKFAQVVHQALGWSGVNAESRSIDVPQQLRELETKAERVIALDNSYAALQAVLRSSGAGR
jgi:threonine synthase